LETIDLLVVGAGIVGLAHAVEAHRRGLSVAVVERGAFATGASVRNFGHLCITPQSGRALDFATAARGRWLDLAATAGFPILESGTLVVARADDEMAVLEELATDRGTEQVTLLDRAAVDRRMTSIDPATVGGALLPLDLRTDPRSAVPAVADWLVGQGVPINWRTSLLGVEPGLARTSRGDIRARQIVVAVGHDVDHLFPDVADAFELERCRLQMLEVGAPHGMRVAPAVLTGLSMLRYAGLANMPSSTRLRERIASTAPHLLDLVVNLMLTQRPNGDIVLGDTHHYAADHQPFDEDSTADLLAAEGALLLGVPRLEIRRRWRGVYASSPLTDFLDVEVHPGVRVVSVTSGIGMTTCHGFAAATLDSLLSTTPAL